MRLQASTGASLVGVAIAFAMSQPAMAETHISTEEASNTIKEDVAQIVAGLNAHDAVRTTAYDAEDIVAMECGSPAMVGVQADRDGFAMGFAHDPSWKVTLISEAVDVSRDGGLAVYRGTYNEDNGGANGVTTHKTNFIAEFKRQADGSWKMAWYIVANMERAHPK